MGRCRFIRCRISTGITCTSARPSSRRDATGLGNPNVLNALARKGLLRHGSASLPSLTLEGRNYQTGLDTTLLHGADH
jgi:hypothetical protein